MIQNAGVVSALPTLASFGVVLSVGFVATLVIARRYATVTAVRKVVQVTGLAVAASLLIGVGYVPRSHVVAAVAMMVLAVGFMGLCLAGHHVNHIDIAPRFSSVLYVGKVGAECVPRCLTALCLRVVCVLFLHFRYGTTNTIANLSAVLSPIVAGQVLGKHPGFTQWRHVFWISAAVQLFGAATWLALASGKQQFY